MTLFICKIQKKDKLNCREHQAAWVGKKFDASRPGKKMLTSSRDKIKARTVGRRATTTGREGESSSARIIKRKIMDGCPAEKKYNRVVVGGNEPVCACSFSFFVACMVYGITHYARCIIIMTHTIHTHIHTYIHTTHT